MLPFGTSAVFDEELTTSVPARVSSSPTVKATAPVVPPSLIVWLAMSEMVGGVFAADTT